MPTFPRVNHFSLFLWCYSAPCSVPNRRVSVEVSDLESCRPVGTCTTIWLRARQSLASTPHICAAAASSISRAEAPATRSGADDCYLIVRKNLYPHFSTCKRIWRQIGRVRKLKNGWPRASPLPLKLRRTEHISDGRSQQRSKKFVNEDNARRNRRNKIQITARPANPFLGHDQSKSRQSS